MVRWVDYEARRRTVLAKAISKYIKEASPVASDDIAKDFDLSSATIRNILANLENEGYLTHRHTSGGRIPTCKGYRYYVDFLSSQLDLLDSEKERIVNEYQSKINRLEDILDKTSELISAVTHYAGIVSFLEWQDKLFYKGIGLILNQPEFQDLERIRLLVKMIEERERLLGLINREVSDKVAVYIGEEAGCPEMQECSLVVCSYRIKNRPSGRLAALGPTRMEYGHIIPALEYISDVLTDVLSRI